MMDLFYGNAYGQGLSLGKYYGDVVALCRTTGKPRRSGLGLRFPS